MMDASKLRNDLRRQLDRVEHDGVKIPITRWKGDPVAVLVPAGWYERGCQALEEAERERVFRQQGLR